MSLNLGNTKIKDIYLGGTKIKEAYLGSSKVYSSGPVGPQLVYLSYLPKTSNYADNPTINTLGVTWSNMTNSACSTQTISSSNINGAMPSSYVNKKTLRTKGSPNGKLDLRSLDEFTVGFFVRALTSISGAGQFFEYRMHTSVSLGMIHFDGGNMKSYVQSSTVKLNNAVVDSTCVWRINNANKSNWCYIQYYVNRPNKLIEIYCNGTKAITISNCVTNLINSGNLNTGIDSIFKIYSDSSSYGNLNIAELAVWNGKHIGVPTAPLG
jgi:hypothetical protein